MSQNILMYHVKRPNVPKMNAPNTHIGVSLYYSFSHSLIDEAINTFVQVDWRARTRHFKQ